MKEAQGAIGIPGYRRVEIIKMDFGLLIFPVCIGFKAGISALVKKVVLPLLRRIGAIGNVIIIVDPLRVYPVRVQDKTKEGKEQEGVGAEQVQYAVLNGKFKIRICHFMI